GSDSTSTLTLAVVRYCSVWPVLAFSVLGCWFGVRFRDTNAGIPASIDFRLSACSLLVTFSVLLGHYDRFSGPGYSDYTACDSARWPGGVAAKRAKPANRPGA
ncbi:unnamed protein product, partial [Callosobruchus maculatus]